LATDALRAFSSERRVGGIVAARTRSAMVAALGNMRVMEQINA
jgi:ABC-type transporter Mla maintaining outer membrane lipid asymmetry permease subunit MlaE